MVNPFSRKGGLKRHKTLEKSDAGRRGRKNRRTEDKVVSSPPPSASENSFEEQSDDLVSEGEEVVYKEPSVYDNLLKSLRSGNDTIAEEGGKSDTEEDVDDESESLSMTEEEDDSEEGIDTESPKSHAMVSKLKSASMAGVVEQSEDTEDEDDEASDMDKEQLGVNGQSLAVSTSSFSFHMGHKLSNSDVDILSNKKWKYKWEMPAVGMSNCKWIGTGECLKDGNDNMSTGYGLKQKLYEHWLDIYKSSGGHDFDSSIQRNFFTLFNSYRDILHHNKKPFYLKGLEEDSSIRDAYIMHSLNHVFRTRDLLMKNNTKLAKQQEGAKEEILVGENFLDHGFTRPKILILLPLASIALRVVRRLIQLTPSAYKVNVDHMDRFSDDFGTGVVEDEEVENEFSRKSSKPSDFQALFGGNNNDHFMVGIKFTKKSVKLYSDFYSSDIIVASPLGLITKIAEAEAEKEKDVDYLSSIEVLIIDHAEVIAMQNWSHVNSVVEKMNCIPSKQHGTDVMRIRHWYLDGHAKFYRQTIILGSYLNPDMNSLYNHHCVNFQGKVKLVCEHKGVLSKVVLQVRQLYERFDAESIGDVDDARFDYFTKKVFPKIKDSVQGGILLFISSYFEFVRIRNFLKSQNASFCLLGEYTKQSDISRSRIWLFEGKRKMMLYTERAHFYHRYKIRGIQNIIIYSLPEKKEFYPEIVNMLEGSHNMNCTVLFSRFDQLRLERIVGTASAKRMTTSEKGVFVFC